MVSAIAGQQRHSVLSVKKKRKIKMIKINTLFLECIEHQKIIVYPTVSDFPLALYDNSASIFLYVILTPVKLPAGNT